jgi:hypothetical protein
VGTKTRLPGQKNLRSAAFGCVQTGGSQRDVVYRGRPIAPLHMRAQMRGGGGGSCGVSANEYSCAHRAQITYAIGFLVGTKTRLPGHNNIMFRKLWLCTNRGSKRDVVYLGRPIAPTHMRAQMRGGCGVTANEYNCAHGAQIDFADITPYLTYASGFPMGSKNRLPGQNYICSATSGSVHRYRHTLNTLF